MFEKLESVEQRYDRVNEQLADPSVTSDIGRYTDLMKELSSLTPVVEKYREYKKAADDYEQAKALLNEGGLDPDLKELAGEEMNDARERTESCAEELKVLLLPKDPNDDKNVIVEIRSGAGGEEAALFAGTLLRMYMMYAEAKGFRTDILSERPTELGGYREVSV
ncbi:MAG: PCRF domain-containing protein, partial [Clostridia bacterium]|nr:PCRF domain-containing protein [Clostridia bacterium]